MATPTTNPPAPTPAQQAADGTLLKRNLAIGLAITCPILIALPPRKLDFYTFGLATTTFMSLNHLQKHNTGRSFLNRIGINDNSPKPEGSGRLPTEAARRYQQMMREKREAERAGVAWTPARSLAEQQTVVDGEVEEDWKAKRDRKEREVFERGEGVGTLIQEYFAEAFGYRKDDEKEDEQRDKKAGS